MPGLDTLLALREVTRAELEAEPDVTVVTGVAYERLHGVDRLHSARRSPAHFFFTGEELRLVYLPSAAVAGEGAQTWLDRFGAGPQLRSRTGKRAVLEVRPDHGVAFAHEDGELQLVELFAPTTLEAYEREIYEDPGSFIR